MLPDSSAVDCGLGIPTNGSPTKRHSSQPQPESKSPSPFHESHIYLSRSYILRNIAEHIVGYHACIYLKMSN